VSRQFHQQALARWLPVQRWYAGKGQVPQSVRYRPLPWASGEDSSWLWGTVRVGEDAEYLLPLAVTWGGAEELEVGPQHPYRIAPVRRHARMGALLDAAADPRFVRDLVRALAAGGETQVGDALLRYRPRPALGNFPTEVAREDVEAPGEIGTNTTVRIGDWGFLKLYRGMHQGVSVEVEVGEFLTERTEFANAVDVLGSIELVAPGEAEGAPVAVLQELVEHQGSAWDLVVGHQRRIIQNLEQRDYLHYMIGLLGQRTGQMHQALCTETGDPAFDPEPVTSDDLRAWVDGVAREAEETFVLLEGRLDSLGGHERELAERLLAARHDVVGRVRGWKGKATGLKKTRYHGDYHLGQVLVVEEDFVVIDFEGEPARSLEERRRKHSALKDVAGLLRSFDYAAFVSAAETLEPSGLSPLDLTLSLGELRETACTEFLDGYREIVGGTGWKAARQMLELFLWEKALYELRYELNTRPQWVVIPLHSLERFFLG
jgi:maltose alpha-D-glucosyltransferase/alpha-amylase